VFTVSVEAERRREYLAKQICKCNMIPFPHEKGTVLGCEYHPKPPEQWDQQDEYDYQAMLETPRSQWI
jgi:hypothetical protein